MKSIFKKIITTIIKFESILIIKKYKPQIIAVTGSVGKTSTKDAIFAVMSGSFFVRKSEKSFNSDIGIPLTILGCQNAWFNPIMWARNIIIGLELIIFNCNYPKWLILEVGADRPGDIKEIAKWLKPNIVVLTTFPKVPVHVEFFKDRDEVVREKRYLVEALKYDGILIVNGDDEDSMKIKGASKNISIIYGTDKLADLVATESKNYYGKDEKIEGITFKVEYEGNIVPIVIKGSLGAKSIYASLAAIAVGLYLKINIVKSGEALLNFDASKGRMKIINGIKNITIIDDTYNSSPVALISALYSLKHVNKKNKGRKIAVLGDMMELGKHSADEHYKVGKIVAEVCDILITVGIRSRKMAEGALDALMSEKNIFQFEDSISAGKELQNIIKENDIILVKGSQSTRMEKVVEEVMLEPEKANKLLVRQEREWKNMI
ncbi:MAG: UDP-N-acetylmuramoyl-tripeptide--D-alanyl-D-alanine ligase [bacterium]